MVENDTTQTEEASAAEAPAHVPAEEKTLTDTQLESFAQTARTNPAEAYSRFGLALFHSLSDEDAQAQLATLKIDGKDALSLYNRGVLLAENGKFTEAAKAFAEAGVLDTSLGEALYNQALATEKAGNAAEARKLWNKYLEVCDDPDESAEIKNHITELANR
jgi:tetratricopeptide (TPR) repeat protein